MREFISNYRRRQVCIPISPEKRDIQDNGSVLDVVSEATAPQPVAQSDP